MLLNRHTSCALFIFLTCSLFSMDEDIFSTMTDHQEEYDLHEFEQAYEWCAHNPHIVVPATCLTAGIAGSIYSGSYWPFKISVAAASTSSVYFLLQDAELEQNSKIIEQNAKEIAKNEILLNTFVQKNLAINAEIIEGQGKLKTGIQNVATTSYNALQVSDTLLQGAKKTSHDLQNILLKHQQENENLEAISNSLDGIQISVQTLSNEQTRLNQAISNSATAFLTTQDSIESASSSISMQHSMFGGLIRGASAYHNSLHRTINRSSSVAEQTNELEKTTNTSLKATTDLAEQTLISYKTARDVKTKTGAFVDHAKHVGDDLRNDQKHHQAAITDLHTHSMAEIRTAFSS